MPRQAKFTPEQRHEMITAIRALPAQLADTVGGLTAEEQTTRYLPNEWTVAQNVFYRLKQILTTDRPQFQAINPDSWAVLCDADNADVETSLNLLRGLHSRWATLFEGLTEEQWQRTAIRANGMEVGIEDLLRIYSGHGQNHIVQIKNTLAAR
jgi:hypothetical protein